MDVLQSLPSDLSTKTNANDLNVSVPVAAAAALQMTTNFLNSVGSNSLFSIFKIVREILQIKSGQLLKLYFQRILQITCILLIS